MQCASRESPPTHASDWLWYLITDVAVSLVNNDIVNIAYQFESDWDAEDISEEDHAEPVQAQLS